MALNNENNQSSQRHIIISAVILAAIVVGAIWFIVLRTSSNKATSASPSAAILSQGSPTDVIPQESAAPFEVVFQSPVPYSASPVPPQTLGQTSTQEPEPVAPTSNTGPEDWVMPVAILAIIAVITLSSGLFLKRLG